MRTYRLGMIDIDEVALIHVEEIGGDISIEVKSESMWAVLQMRFEEVKSDAREAVEESGEKGGQPVRGKADTKRRDRPARHRD